MASRADIKKPCKWTGCAEFGGQRRGYCATHTLVAKVCIIGGCGTRIASWNYHELCKEHRWLLPK